MAVNKLKLKRSAVAGKEPATSSLDLGELAINTIDGKVYLKKESGSLQTIVELASTSGSIFSASYAQTSSHSDNFTVVGPLSVYGNEYISGSLVVTNDITAQRLIVQTITSSVIYSSGSNIFGDALSDTQQFTGSVTITGSLTVNGTIGNFTGSTGHIPKFYNPNNLDDSAIFQSGSTSIVINQNNVTTANPEALYVWQPHPTSINVVSGKGNLDNYLQLNIQNTNQGVDASSDIVATANNGDETIHYIDMGINSENFAGFLGGPNDAYLYSTGHDLWIGNYTDGRAVKIFNSSSLSPIIVLDVDGATKIFSRVSISGSLNVSSSLIAQSFITRGATAAQFVKGDGTLDSTLYTSASVFNNTTSSLQAFSASMLNFTASTLVNSGSFDTRIKYLSSSFESNTASFNAYSASMNAFSASILSTTASVNNFSSSVLNFTASTLVNSASFDTRINYVSSSFEAATASLNLFSASMNTTTASMNAFSSSVLNFTASTLVNSASFDTRIGYVSSSFEAATASLNLFSASMNATTASINAFSSSILNFTASTLVNSASFDTRINYVSSSFEAATASLNAFSSSVLNFTASTLVNSASFDTRINYISSSFNSSTASFNAFSASMNATTASLNAFSSSMLSFTASQKDSNGTFATTGSNIFKGNQTITGSLSVSGSTNIYGTTNLTGSVNVSGSIGTAISANVDTIVFTGSYAQSGSATIVGNLTVTDTITAQKLIVQTVSSSVIYSSGSNKFGNDLSNTQVFTGSVDITGSLTVNGRNYITDSGSFDTRIKYVSASFEAATASLNLFSASVNAFSASVLSFTASALVDSASFDTRIQYVSTSFEAHTASFNAFSSSILSTTASINAFSSSVLSFTASALVDSASFDTRIGYVSSSFEAATASINLFSASVLSYTASNNEVVAKLYAETSSLLANTASMNLFSSSMLNFTASTLVNSASFDTRIQYVSTSFEAHTASFNAFSSSMNANTASMNAFSASVLSFTSSTLTNSASFDTRIKYVSSSFEAATASLNNFSSSVLAYTASNNITIQALYAETASLEAATASLNLFSASMNATTASMNAFSASVLNYTSSQNDRNGTYATTGSNTFYGVETVSGSVDVSGSINLTGTQIITGNLTVTDTITAERLIVQYISSSVIYSSGSNKFGDEQSDIQQFTGSVDITGSLTVNGRNYLTDSASFDTRIQYVSTSFEAHTASINNFSSSILSTTASINNFSSSVLNFTASTLVNSASFDTRIKYVSSSFEAATASLNAFSASILNYTASNNAAIADILIETASLQAATASLNLFSASILSFTASQKDANGTFATTGSNIFKGDQILTGSLSQSGSLIQIGSSTLTGSLLVSGSTTQTGNNTLIGNTQLTGSIGVSGSQTFVGTNTLTGSFLISGSTTQIGNNSLVGDTLLSGSITISSSLPVGSYSSSVNIYGDTSMTGYLKFNPQATNIDTNASASYIFVSGSTNDLYFSQNGGGFSNVTRLRWIEGNMYTGLLHGGLISATTGSTTFNLSSGSGIIVSLNASIATDPYPTIKYVNWNNLTNQPLTYLTSSIQTYIGIDNGGNIVQQNVAFNNGTYNEIITIGTVLHQNKSTVNASITYPNVAYGYKQRTYDFLKAFGALKLSGLNIATSSSLGLTVSSGTAYADGRNYQVDPNNPSYIVDPGTEVSKIFRYYQSGSEFVQDTNGGLGYTVINPSQYNPGGSGSLAAVPGTGINREWSIQRVFWYPNSATKGIVVYYGNTTYTTNTAAIANLPYENFLEVENTKQNAVYLGAIVLRNDALFTDSTTYVILPGGLFRNVGGSGGGGVIASTLLSQLGDVTISGPTSGQALVYDSIATKWENKSFISASISGNAGTATLAATASSADNLTVRGTLTAQNIVVQTISSSVDYVSGSTKFGTLSSNTHEFTGSVTISGSLAVTNGVINSLTSSYAVNADLLDGLDSTQFVLTSSFNAYSSSMQAFSASVLNYTASNNTTIQALYAETASIQSTTASFNAFSSSILNYTASTNATIADILIETASLQAATASLNAFSASALAYTASNDITISAIFAETASIQAYTASAKIDSGSVSTRLVSLEAFSSSLDSTFATDADLNTLSSSFVAHTSSINAFSASINSYTASVNSTIAALYAETASISSYTASNNALIADILVETASLQAFSASILNYTASNNTTIQAIYAETASILAHTASINAFSASVLNYTASNNSAISSLYSATASLNLATASLNNFSASVLSYTASAKIDSGSVSTRLVSLEQFSSSLDSTFATDADLNALSSSFIAYTASLNNFSASVLSYTASNNAAIASIYNTTSSLSSSIALLSGSFLSASSSFDTRINSLTESVFTHVVTNNGSSNYIIDGIAKPILSLVPGATYRFDTTAVGGSHPFKFSTSPNGPTQYTTGVTSGSNYIQIEVNYDTPTPLYYYCTIHSGMGNEINVLRIENLVTTSSFNNFSSSIQSFSSSILNFTASQNNLNGTFATTGSNIFEGVQTINSNLVVTGSITAQTLIVQTITSSVDFVTGSTHFGTIIDNTHQFTGSVSVSGSLAVNDSNVILTNQTASMSVATASQATNVVGAANRILFNSATNTTTTSNNLTWEDSINLMTLGSATGVAGTISKIALYTSSYGGYGFGVSPAQLDYVSDGSHVFYKNGITPTELVRIANDGVVSVSGSLNVNGSNVILTNQTSSMSVLNAQTASYWSGSIVNVTSASFASTASYWSGSIQNAVSASFAELARSASFASTASFALNGGGGGTGLTALYILDEGIVQGTASYLDFNGAGVTATVYGGTASINIPGGGGGSSQSGGNSILTQSVANVTWSFTHNLETQYPVFTIFDANNDVIIPQRINAVNTSSALIYFSTARTGYAVASKGGDITSASYALIANSSSFSSTASFVQTAQTASYVVLAQSASYWSGSINNVLSASYAATASHANNFTVAGTLTAQTLIVQTITSSIVYSSGSNIFGNDLSNTQVLTGSVTVTGSLAVNGSNVVLTSQTSSMSVATASYWSGSIINAQTASFVTLSQTASYWSGSIQNAVSAAFADLATSSSYAATASFALNGGGGGISAISIADEGILQGSASYFDFTGAGVSVSVASNTASFTITGGGGGGTQGLTTQFTQSVAAVSWSFTHNLNTRTPVVQVYDSGYNQIAPQYISSSDASTIVIGFGVAATGYAVVSTGGALYITGSNVILNQTVAATTWSFNHGLNTQYPVFQVFNTDNEVIVPQVIKAVDSASALIYFPTPVAGKAVAALGGISGSGGSGAGFPFSGSAVITGSFLVSGSFVDFTQVGSFTGNLTGTASYATFALTASTAPGYTVQFSQTASSATWSFTHNMGTRNPIVQVYGSDYKQLIPNEIVGIDGSTVEVRFDYAATGYAILSNGGGLYITGSTSTLIQTTSAVTWSFNHQLNTKYPAFEVYDSNDYVIIPAGIKVIDTDNAELYFAGAQAGRAIANFSGINGLQDNAVSASYASSGSIFHVDKVVMDRSLMDFAQVNSSIVGSNNMFTQATGSYTSMFVNYTVANGANARSGQMMAVWYNNTSSYTDVTTTDIGNTTAVTGSISIVTGEAQLNFQTNTSGWRIKSTATFI